MEVMSGEFPGHSGAGIPLHYRNVLVLLALWYGARSYINIQISSICHFNVMNNTPLFMSQKRQASAADGSPDLYTDWSLYSSLYTSHYVCAKHDNSVNCYDHEIQR